MFNRKTYIEIKPEPSCYLTSDCNHDKIEYWYCFNPFGKIWMCYGKSYHIEIECEYMDINEARIICTLLNNKKLT